MVVLTWVSLGVGVAALVLAVVALNRSVPAFTVGPPQEGRYEFWHQGPGPVVVRKAYVADAAGAHPLGSERSGVEAYDIDGMPLPIDAAFGKGQRIPPHRRYVAHVNVNRDVVIEYGVPGLLGRLSTGVLRIEEGP